MLREIKRGKNASGNVGEKDAGSRGKVAAPATNFHCRHCIHGRGCADAEKEKFDDVNKRKRVKL